jgi:predicted dehydrogenase
LLRLVAEGRLGALRQIRLCEGALTTATGMSSDFRDDVRQSGGGILIDLGSHGIDLACQIAQTRAADILSHRVVFDGDIDREVTLQAVLHGGEAPIGLSVELSWLRDIGRELVLEFEDGSARVGVGPGDTVVLAAPGSARRYGFTSQRERISVWEAVSRAWSTLLADSDDPSVDVLAPATCLPSVSLIEQVYTEARRA